ncbi:MAG: DUF456 family protein [Kaiparowitsia implicata GSE-PSE-MK54-09C]|jgi:uncharacterized protein YqgC (DUF456 family)|nr:DUF456 family protein [Kaiparowitsia implicata GSE-PSE-MK54-09C]
MILLYIILVILMGVGILGAVLPGVPGVGLIAIAIAIWGAFNGFAGVTIPLVVAVVSLLLCTALDFAATYWGAKKFGATRWGLIGAFVGLLLGFVGLLPALPVGGPFLGALFGPLLGALVGEFLYRRNLALAAKAAVGILVGNIFGRIVQLVLAIATTAIFLFATIPGLFGPASQPALGLLGVGL